MMPHDSHPRSDRRAIALLGLLVALLFRPTAARADELADARDAYRTGKYDACLKLADAEIETGLGAEPWHHLRIKARLDTGRYEQALGNLDEAARRFPTSITLPLLGREVYLRNGRPDDAATALVAVQRRASAWPQRYANTEGRIALGRYFLLKGADARQVLDQFYDVAVKQDPDDVDAALATARLALDKQDDSLAASSLEKAPKAAAYLPEYHYLLALAFESTERTRSNRALEAALKINPSHPDSLLLRADHLIDSEKYAEAADVLKNVLALNNREPRAWAYHAVLAHLLNDPDGEAKARASALASWGGGDRPEIDHLFGKKLSQKYRFAEGSAAQRKALLADPDYQPAKVQLCEDLLRLGQEDEGWALAAEIFAKDAYNVVAYNLVTLRDRLAGFRTLKAEGLLVRMEPREADLYGDRVLALLAKARATLCAKYGAAVAEPVVVEIFPRKQEFAVRTFGMPGAEGLLGVCFGRVITANSPASQGETPSNWEAVLWHEYCHAVTLGKTRNKMPRWLSEGISVYEEQAQDPAWGSPLNPQFRDKLLDKSLTPLSRLSSAFLAPETALDLQFAYFESALAVEFLVGRAGLPALKSILDDLGTGTSLNDALPKHAKMTLEQLDAQFASFARDRAKAVAPEAAFDKPELPADASAEAIAAWLKDHPKNFPGQRRLAAKLMADQQWKKAVPALEALKTLYPSYLGPDNAYVSLARAHRKLDDPAAEHADLDVIARLDGGASQALLRLMELDSAAKNWPGLAQNARRLLAVNPLIAAPHRELAVAAEHLDRPDEALASYRALALLDDSDPANTHYKLASLLLRAGKPAEARREVLKSLEEAPRFLDAHKLLLQILDADPAAKNDVPPPPNRVR